LTVGRGAGLRVLYVDTAIGLGGGQHSLIAILRFLDPGKVTPVVAAPPESGLAAFCAAAGFRVTPLRFAGPHTASGGRTYPGRVRRVSDAVRAVFRLARIARLEGADIIHANTFRAAMAAAAVGRLGRVPMVFHNRTVYTHGPVGGLVARAAARIIAISRTTACPYEPAFAPKIRIVPIGIDVDRFRPRGGAPPGPVIAYLGRISPEKGLIDLVRSAPRVLARVPAARFVVGGRPFTTEGGKYLRAVKAEIAELGLESRFAWPGYVEDVPAFLARAAVVAVPSKEEGLGRAMLEAMAMGLPVVAFDRGGPAETITSGKDGVLVRPGDAGAMGDAIADLLTDRAQARRVGEAARALVAARYSAKASAQALVDVYEEVAAAS